MNFRLQLSRTRTTTEGFAEAALIRSDGTALCDVDLQTSMLRVLPTLQPAAIDLLLVASSIYCLDKLVPRSSSVDAWTRELSLQVPVSDETSWNSVKGILEECISFLSGDLWEFRFVRQAESPFRATQIPIPCRADVVSLFSGGLDSLVGAIDWLNANPAMPIVLVGHHDGQMAGPLADQYRLLGELKASYQHPISPIFMRVGHKNESVERPEITLRSRSLLFVALGILSASSIGPNVQLLVPENGTIALNIPLTPSRRGSCSTRTTHPYYLSLLSRVLAGVGLSNRISNPLEGKTKGEAVSQCLDHHVLEHAAPLSVSCAKRGHRSHFTHRSAKACGRCLPCIYRRAALHTMNWDNELYGDDVCIGDVDVLHDMQKANDWRACLSFLKRDPSTTNISSLLLANGRLEVARLPQYAALVKRAMNEIRLLLRDKASADIKRMAGI